MKSRIDEEDIPDIDDIIGDEDEDYNDEDTETLKRLMKKAERFARTHKLSARTLGKMKLKDLRELNRLLREINMLLLAETRLKRRTFPSYVKEHERLRRRLLESLLKPLSVESRIYVLQEMLADECGDEEAYYFYIW